MKYTALVILNYNNTDDTRQCIESIERINTAPIKYIVVDNSTDPAEIDRLTAEMRRLFSDKLQIFKDGAKPSEAANLTRATLVTTGRNLGYGKGNNAGIEFAMADDSIDRIMILNNDVIFIEDIVEPLSALLRSLPDCAIISPVLLKKGLNEYDLNCARLNTDVQSLVRDNLLHYWRLLRRVTSMQANRKRYLLYGRSPNHATNTGDTILPIELPSGSCMLVEKAFFAEIGCFDPATFMYFEENILYKKIAAIDKRNYLSMQHRCVHLGASTTTRITNAWLVRQAKNSERYYVENYSGARFAMRLLHRFSVAIYMALYNLQKKLAIHKSR